MVFGTIKHDSTKESRVGERALRSIVTDLETMGLVDTWMESRGGAGRTRQIETTFDPTVVRAVRDRYIRESPHLDAADAETDL